ncbi:hypothetical protein HCN44_004937 [Aphidius gifuensis]|uniref:Transcription initiation factor TFIID subunit 12 n=1 Tax=Aphidius gifuensis TaxID=684658 RepID=A0A834XSE0_APHGI|nr:transcription initiation factor TFIID subunit 12 [Aphidius gifuensis]KAF7992593.1 hypothetical protein HCN44_004937 [Aphidius gifuensis]
MQSGNNTDINHQNLGNLQSVGPRSQSTMNMSNNNISEPGQQSQQQTNQQNSMKNQQSSSSSSETPQFLSKARLQELVKEIDPIEQLDEDVEEMLLQLADDFVETTVNAACLLAKHRHANSVEVKDVQLHLERNWNMWIPGFGTDEVRPYKRSTVTEAHKQRLALIRKSVKKY